MRRWFQILALSAPAAGACQAVAVPVAQAPNRVSAAQPTNSNETSPAETSRNPLGFALATREEPPAERPLPQPGPTGDAAQPWFGAGVRAIDAGLEVEHVRRGSPAASAGVLPGDILLSLDGEGVQSPEGLHDRLARAGVGSRLSLSVRRAGQQRLLSLVLAIAPTREAQLRAEYLGAKPPSISRLSTVQGSQVPSWAALQGHVAVLEFWAGWCVACRALTPTLNRFHETLSARGVRVLAVTSEPFEEANRAAHLLDLRYPVFADEDGAVTQAFQAVELPSIFVVDKRGVIRELLIGFHPAHLERLAGLLAELIRE